MIQAIGGAADAARMQRVVAFYEKLPRGPAPEAQPKGLIQRYQHRYMNGKNARAMRTYNLGTRLPVERTWMCREQRD